MHVRLIAIGCAAALTLALAHRADASQARRSTVAAQGRDAPSAEPIPPLATGPTTELRAELGISSPVGVAGFTATLDLRPNLRLEGGVGLGPTGIQLSLMPRYVLGSGTARLLFGLGPSLSSWGKSGTLLWLNAEPIGLSLRFDDGVTGFASGGLAIALAGERSGGLLSQSVAPGNVFPLVRIGLGYAF